MTPPLDLRSHLAAEFRAELRQPLRALLAAAKRYRRDVRVSTGAGQVAWTPVMLAGLDVHRVLADWRQLGITAEDVLSPERQPKTFYLVAAAYALFDLEDAEASDESYRRQLDLFRRCALGAGG